MPLAEVARLLRHPTLRGTVAVQGLGSVATLATGLVIAWALGPAAQGHYAWLRASADLLLALALLGLPQGIVHLLGRARAQPAALHRLLLGYLVPLALAALALAAALDAGALPWRVQGPGAVPVSALLLAVGVLGWTAHALQRAFALSLATTATFSWLTAAPALALLAVVVLMLALGASAWEWAIAASGVASLALGALVLGVLARRPAWLDGLPPPRRELLRASAHSLWQVVAMALQPWLALTLLRALGGGATELGWFMLATQVQLLWVLPAGYVVPLLYARASAAGVAGGPARPFDVSRSLLAAAALSAVAALAVAALLPWAVPAALGERYLPAVAACVCMALGGPAALLGRLGAALLLGQGRFGTASLLHTLRLLLLAAGVGLWTWWAPASGWLASPVGAVALAWTVAEVLVALATFALRPEMGGGNGPAAANAAA